jgi:hypothetical protein
MSNITAFLQKAFQSLEGSIILPMGEMGYFLVRAAKSQSYVETLGKHADSLHSWIKKSYEEDFQASFNKQVLKAISILRVNYARLAFDVTSEPFYGKTTGLYIIGCEPDKKWNSEFKFATVCLIVRNKQIPLMAFPVRVGSNTALTIELVKYCQSLFDRIIYATFDRGYYISELIDYLEAQNIKYLILVPEKKGKISEFVDKTDTLGIYPHEMLYSKEKSRWRPRTHIVVCRGIDEFPWIFATNIHFKTRAEYLYYYGRRWQIETNFRVEDEAKIKSKSSDHMIRYFYFLVSLLLHLFWIVNKNIKKYAPFKKYLDNVEQALMFDYLEIHQTRV